MGSDKEREFTVDPSVNFSALDDYMTKANAKEKGRISQRVYNHVSDMAIINEVISAIRSEKQRNRNPPTDILKARSKEEFRSQWIKKVRRIDPCSLADQLAPRLKIACKNHSWPVGKKDLRWLEQAKSSRKSLSEFWAAMRPLYFKQLRSGGILQPFIDEEISLLSADKSAEYMAEVKQESEYIQKQEEVRRAALDGSLCPLEKTPNPPLRSIPGKENARFTPLQLREKPKSRPEASLSGPPKKVLQTSLNATLAPEKSQLESRKIAVKPENMNLFLQMFPSPSSETSGRTFKWQHFLDAMVEAGLSIRQGSGSAVNFAFDDDLSAPQSDSVVDAGSIVFHRPHPIAEIHPVMMRTMGKRMSKWFGWRRETFVEKQKEGD